LVLTSVAKLNLFGTDFKLLEVMSLPAAYTKDVDAMKRSKATINAKPSVLISRVLTTLLDRLTPWPNLVLKLIRTISIQLLSS